LTEARQSRRDSVILRVQRRPCRNSNRTGSAVSCVMPVEPDDERETTDAIAPEAERSRFTLASGRRYAGMDNEAESSWSGEWTFAVLADTQFGLLGASFVPRVPELKRHFSVSPGDVVSGLDWDTERQMAIKAVQHLNRLMPKFVIVCGDMVDAMPETGRVVDLGRDGRDDALKQAQVDDWKLVFGNLHPSIHLLCVCGNHDVGNVPNRKTIADYRREFGDDYFAFNAGGCRCLVLNTQLHNSLEKERWEDKNHRHAHFSEDEKAEAQELAHEQNAWLEEECRAIVERPPPAHVLCFSHIPPFIRRPDEPKGYYNLEEEVRRTLLDTLKAAGCTKWFAGHYHQNAGGTDGSLEVVITGAAGGQIPFKVGVSPDSVQALSPGGQDFFGIECSEEVSGIRLVKVTREAVSHEWLTFAQLNDFDPS